MENKKMKALVCGHTGATGKALLELLASSDQVESIVCVGRRENEQFKNHPKVKQYIVSDMTKIQEEDLSIAQGCNVAFCTIGTPFMDVFKKSKRESFKQVDFGIATEFAKFARKAGVTSFTTITGEGTDSDSDMYMYSVKREVENLVKNLGFEHVAIMRPGFLYRGKDASWMEKLMLARFFGLPVARVAKTMIWAMQNQAEHFQGYDTRAIQEIAMQY
jgi:NADPH:quinone reductase-like Zn-dependent oxidoreductase